jgi:hypothetical protein
VRRSVLLVPVLIAVTSLTGGCGGSSGSADESVAPPIPSPSLAPTPTSVASGVASDSAQVNLALTVAKGKVTGDTGRVKVPLGSRVRITVTSDVADEIHVHLYDLKQEISANQPGSIEFTADKPGVIEVELERAKLPLTRLAIS